MTSRARIAVYVLATSCLTCLCLPACPEDPAPLQKTPILLPDKVLLPATLEIQPWDNTGIPTIVVSIGESRVESAAIATGLNANVIS